jgi:hypothetical protein
MKNEFIKKLIDESNKLMIFTMSMQNATKYVGDPKFDSANFSRILQGARKEMEGENESNS